MRRVSGSITVLFALPIAALRIQRAKCFRRYECCKAFQPVRVELNIFIRIALCCGIALRAISAQGPLIDYVTYLGGAFADGAVGIAVDSDGSAYVAGGTVSPDFPITSTTLGTPSATAGCSFITKFNPSGTAIDFSVCIAHVGATAFARDKIGNLYLASASTTNTVLKLDPSAQNILYNTPIGAYAESMTVDAAGNIYVTGAVGPGLATTPGAYQSKYPGGPCRARIGTTPCNNAFITKLTPTGSIAWTTYLGGSGPDDAHAIAVDGAGNVWVAGETVSPDFPTTAGAISRTFHGEVDDGPVRYGDAFVAELDPTGRHLLYSTYLGGSLADGAFNLAVDATGAVYVAGGTDSTDFPTSPGAYKTTYAGDQNQPPSFGEGFVTKLDTSGSLVYSTFTGIWSGVPTPITVDDQGQAYVSGDAVPPSTSMEPTCAAPPNVSVLVLNSAGSALVATSPIPGAYFALDGKGGLYSAGRTLAPVFFSTPHAFQIEYGGGDSDAFAAKVDFSQPAAPSLASVVNAASFFPGYASNFPLGDVAPGEIVTLFGDGFGSDKPSVYFSQYPATVLYSSNCQINAVVPFEVNPGYPTFVTVNQSLGPIKLPVSVAAPGVFNAILNQDSTLNSPSNPAARGSIVSIFMTGTGRVDPPIPDGSLGPLTPPYPAPLAPVSAIIGGISAPVVFVGQAPGLIAGATQLNLQIPQNVPVGAAIPIQLFVADYASPFLQPVTMAVR